MDPHEATLENQRFGSYLRRIREERKLSLDAVGEMSSGFTEQVTKSHLSRIENGQALPTFPKLFALSQIYGIPVSSLAERFEIECKREMVPADLEGKPDEQVLKEARRLRLSGLHAEALAQYEGLLQRHSSRPAGKQQLQFINELRLHVVNCLVQLARFASAKDQCENLLSVADFSAKQQVQALQLFAICCYRLKKYTVAIMAIERAEREIEGVEDSEVLFGHLGVLKGNVLQVTGRAERAAEAYKSSLARFEELSVPFEACRTRVNLASALVEAGARGRAVSHLRTVLKQAESAGYDRLRVVALSTLGQIAYLDNDPEKAEAYCLRSNAIARPREYVSVMFRNCFYLWKIALERRDRPNVKANEATLRTYLSRADDYLPEVQEFRAHLEGGGS